MLISCFTYEVTKLHAEFNIIMTGELNILIIATIVIVFHVTSKFHLERFLFVFSVYTCIDTCIIIINAIFV